MSPSSTLELLSLFVTLISFTLSPAFASESQIKMTIQLDFPPFVVDVDVVLSDHKIPSLASTLRSLSPAFASKSDNKITSSAFTLQSLSPSFASESDNKITSLAFTSQSLSPAFASESDHKITSLAFTLQSLSLFFTLISFTLSLAFASKSDHKKLHIFVKMLEFTIKFLSIRSLYRDYTAPEEVNAAGFQMQESIWSQLPNDIMSKVVNRLTILEDFIALSLVCRDWGSFCSNMNWTQGPQSPWLILSENANSNTRRFFSLYYNRCYQLGLQMRCGRRYYGTTQGWIIAVGPDLQAHLLHPLRQYMIVLPGLNALQNEEVGVLIDWFNLIIKFIAFKISDDKFLVMAIFGPLSRLAYAESGDNEWVIVGNAIRFKDVAFFQGDYYALCARGVLKLCELLGQDSMAYLSSLPPIDVETPGNMYLVVSNGKLFGVFRYGSFNVSEERYKTVSFKVYKFQSTLPVDFPLPRWTRVNDLEDCSFFVGDSNSLSICASNNVNCKRNCIYFTDDNWETIGEMYGGHDIGIFDMASREIEYLNFGVDSPSDYSRPIWLAPTLR